MCVCQVWLELEPRDLTPLPLCGKMLLIWFSPNVNLTSRRQQKRTSPSPSSQSTSLLSLSPPLLCRFNCMIYCFDEIACKQFSGWLAFPHPPLLLPVNLPITLSLSLSQAPLRFKFMKFSKTWFKVKYNDISWAIATAKEQERDGESGREMAWKMPNFCDMRNLSLTLQGLQTSAVACLSTIKYMFIVLYAFLSYSPSLCSSLSLFRFVLCAHSLALALANELKCDIGIPMLALALNNCKVAKSWPQIPHETRSNYSSSSSSNSSPPLWP